MCKNKFSFSMWIKYLEKLKKKNQINLIDIKHIARKLNLLNLKSFFFTVGGTNGKGTTCAMLEKLLLDSGYQVGLYTSPHLLNFVERVKINGLYVTEMQYVFAFLNIHSAKLNYSLSYFEFITLAALFLFKQYSLDIIILEVGLGGRLDATNIIDSDLSVITNIGIDHTSILGVNRFNIAREKAGIFRKNKISVIGEKDIPDSIYQEAKTTKTILKIINKDWYWEKYNNTWNLIHSKIALYNLPIPKIPLPNAAIALSALFYSDLDINKKKLRHAIAKIQLPGRFQTISCFPHIIVDVAHNAHAALYLSKKIDQMDIQGNIYAIFGVLKDKDISSIVAPLRNKISYWYTSTLSVDRSASLDQLKSNLPIQKTFFFNSISNAWNNLKKILNKKDIVLVFGSFITVSEFISIKQKK
ncbi:bifunctional tetrahydrofolate synthase/dihydrofolate synthase [Buchnera aphidicola (Aphis helianthi)]|uniref:Dihydrofolate synthase/folylpolyglutamate synthase n=1 Tax=Buchnera aphidicola (Aphis helianthi) TaxID=2315802 RepID=A0A4D6XQ11_9GAMM|nr:bifunctional tetrahydrofolate synthase/dihydrofolate synthase [Buchnera aphidicola]QCI16998.1 bifunctional tetrahydrofolate synthase/dihydrofolate synthase [Buchnera aphidicola (Aphis helianthi)]